MAHNPAVQRGAPLASYFLDPGTQSPGGTEQGLYRPLRTLSFRAVRLVAPGPGAQRIANLLLHVANGLLVFLLLVRLLSLRGESEGERGALGRGGLVAPCLGALAFAVHPLAAESVAFVSSRGDLLALTGILASVLLYLGGRGWWRWCSLLAFALALLSKESAAVLPCLLVLLDAARGGRKEVRARLWGYAPFVLVLAGYLGLRYAVLGGSGFAQGGGMGLPLLTLAGSLFNAAAYYVWTTLAPIRLSFELRIDDVVRAPVVGAIGFLLVVGLVGFAWRARKRTPQLFLAVGWFFSVLLPVTAIQLVFPLKILVANRFAYPALVGAALALAWFAARGRPHRVLALAVVAAFVPFTLARARCFATPKALWQDVLTKDPGNPVALFGLGFDALRHDAPGAVPFLRRAARAAPGHPRIDAMLGIALERRGAAASGAVARRRDFSLAAEAYARAAAEFEESRGEERSLYPRSVASAAWLLAVLGRPERAAGFASRYVMLMEADGAAVGQSSFLRRRARALADYFRRIGDVSLAEELDGVAGGGASKGAR